MKHETPRILSRQRQTHREVGAQSLGSGHVPDSRAAEGGATHSSTGTSWSSVQNTGRPLCFPETARLLEISAGLCLSRASLVRQRPLPQLPLKRSRRLQNCRAWFSTRRTCHRQAEYSSRSTREAISRQL